MEMARKAVLLKEREAMVAKLFKDVVIRRDTYFGMKTDRDEAFNESTNILSLVSQTSSAKSCRENLSHQMRVRQAGLHITLCPYGDLYWAGLSCILRLSLLSTLSEAGHTQPFQFAVESTFLPPFPTLALAL